MCIICIKKAGVLFPTVETVKTMCENNSHGFSLVISGKKGAPQVYKSLNMGKFIKLYQKLSAAYDYRTSTMYIHARIKTHGTQRIENCHGWKAEGLVFAHNGILSISNRDDLTDSETYFRDIFIPAYKMGGWKAGERTIDAIIGTSKFVFMDKKGEIHHYGQYIEEDGLLFSNDSYIPWRQRYVQKPATSNKWSGYYNGGYHDYYDDDFYAWLDSKK